MPSDRNLKLEFTATPAEADLRIISNGLNGFNLSEGISHLKIPVAVFARDNGGKILAGLFGNIAWGWLHIRWLWINENLRGRGMAAELLALAEREAADRNCHGAYIDTFSPPALRVYQRAGYEIFGQLEDFPIGRTRTFLQKRLKPSGSDI